MLNVFTEYEFSFSNIEINRFCISKQFFRPPHTFLNTCRCIYSVFGHFILQYHFSIYVFVFQSTYLYVYLYKCYKYIGILISHAFSSSVRYSYFVIRVLAVCIRGPESCLTSFKLLEASTSSVASLAPTRTRL